MGYNRLFIIKVFHYIVEKLFLPKILKIECNDYYHQSILSYLQKYFNEAMNKVRLNNIKSNNKTSNVIWVFWWQGYANMPKIVESCINSIKRHSNGHKVIFLNKNNIKLYVHLPKYIYYKLNKHQIDLIHFSDILRANLLNNYGGLWIDSTVYCISNLTSECFGPLYTLNGHVNNNNHQFISTKWCSFMLGGYKNDIIFQFLDEFEQIYWKYNNKLIVYLLLDYALDYAYKNNLSNFKYYCDNIAEKNNLHTNGLIHLINTKYDKNIYNRISNNTTFFKLTYKDEFNTNKDSFYTHLINGKL